MLSLFNTLRARKETFTPIEDRIVRMYHCGPTVYHFAHLGNLRAFVFADILKRAILYEGYSAVQVINITDVGHLVGDGDLGEDKIEEEAKRENKTAKEIAAFYTQAFFDDIKKLNIDTTGTLFPHATEYIKEQIALIERLEKKSYTYKTSDGIYFDTSRFPDYGKLGDINLSGIEEGARVEANPEKRNPTDFALWKFSSKGGEREQEWESSWGIGFPGWHIECSAMAMKLLGETLDIHTGGIDHIPVHHNNEIAQSQGATEKEFVRFWLHNAFVTVEDEKMSKSKGNFLRLQSIIDHRIHPLAYRYSLLTAHYRSPILFSWEATEGADVALKKLWEHVASLPEEGKIIDEYHAQFKTFIEDDLDTPKALALLWKLIKDQNAKPEDKKATVLDFDRVLGLNLLNPTFEKTIIPGEVQALVSKREKSREQKDFNEADRLREEIEAMGFEVRDTPHGPFVKKK